MKWSHLLDVPFYSFKKSKKLRSISRRIYKAQVISAASRKEYEEGSMTLGGINYGYDKKELIKVLDDFYKAREELFDFCENDRFIKEDIKHHGINRTDLGYLFFALDSFLAGKEYAKGHLVLVSIFFYSQTLHYCLSREKLGIGWSELIERCYKYFDKNEVRNIIPYWK